MAKASGQVASVARRGGPAAGRGSSGVAPGASGARDLGVGPAAVARLKARRVRLELAVATPEEFLPRPHAFQPPRRHQLHWPHSRTAVTGT